MAVISRKSKNLYILGAFLIGVGSLLPWWCEGDFIWYCYRGFQVRWIIGRGLVFFDNGGLVVLLLTVLFLVLIFKPPFVIREPEFWATICGAGLVLVCGYHFVRWIVGRIQTRGIIGAAEPRLGFIMVLIGSLILATVAWLDWHKGEVSQPRMIE